MEAREIDRRGQSGRSAADDQAIEGIIHMAPSAWLRNRFRLASSADLLYERVTGNLIHELLSRLGSKGRDYTWDARYVI